MGTTTSSPGSTTDDPYRTAPSPANWFGGAPVGASPLAGRINAPAPPGLPPQLAPGYRPPLPAQITPNAPWTTGSPATADYNNRPPAAPAAQVRSGQQYDPITLQPLGLNDPRRVGGPFMGITEAQPVARAGEAPPIHNMPPVWQGNQVGPSGMTKQQFLTNRMMHESQGDPTALNYVARNNPAMYAQGYTASGILQDVNTTWKNGVQWAMADPAKYPMSADPRNFATARDAPWDVQWQVNSAIYDHSGEQPWRGPGSGLGDARMAMGPSGSAGLFQASYEQPTQAFLPAEPREFHSWGQPAEGQARHQDLGTIMGRFAPLLLGIASLALRLPLSTAVTAYSAMARAQYNGQEEAYQRSRTQWQDAWNESQARGNMESRDYGDAFAEYGQNNPQGLQQELARLALRYNDPAMLQMAERGDLQGAYQMQQRRDQLLATMGKGNRLIQDQQDQQEVERTLQARMRQWDAQNPNATPDERQVAEFNTRTELQDQMAAKTGKGAAKTPSGTQAIAQSHLDAADAATRQWVTDEKAAGRNPTDDQIKIHRDQELDKALQGGRAGGTSLTPYSGPDTWPGSPNTPPPDPDITPAVWSQALLLASKGAPVPLGRGVPEAAAIRKAYPVAQAALGIDPAAAAERQQQFAANQAALTAVSRYFGSGQAATQMRSLNTVVGHIDLFRRYAAAMDTGDNQTANRIGQAMAVELGHPEVTDFRLAATMMGDEIVRLLTNTGGTSHDRQDMQDKIASYMSQGQLSGVADVAENFVHSRFDGLQQEWVHPPGITQTERQVGERTAQFREMMTPDAQQMFVRPLRPIPGEDQPPVPQSNMQPTIQPAPVPGTQIPAMTEEQYNAAPSGTRYRMPNDPPGTVRVKP